MNAAQATVGPVLLRLQHSSGRQRCPAAFLLKCCCGAFATPLQSCFQQPFSRQGQAAVVLNEGDPTHLLPAD